MSCICGKLKKGNFFNDNVSCESIEYQNSLLEAPSATELSYMKAQVWILEKKLEQNINCMNNLMETFKKVANEKFELIQELTKQNVNVQKLCEHLQRERDDNTVLQNEIECLQEEVDSNRVILEKVVTQNVGLKESIVEKDETIHQMGLMYLKLKEYKN